MLLSSTDVFISPSRALVRPGRFDKKIAVPLPDILGRMQILKHHMQGVLTETGKTAVLIIVEQYLMPQIRMTGRG